MKVEIMKKELSEVLAKIKLGRSALPILECVKLETSEGKLKIIGTNLELSICYEIPCKISEVGSCFANLKDLKSICKILPENMVLIGSDNPSKLKIMSGDFKANLQSDGEFDNFPIIPKLENKSNFVSIDAEILKQTLDKVSFSISSQETRYVLCGVLFHSVNGKLKIVTTDGKCLSVANLDVEHNLKNPFIINGNSLMKVKSILKNGYNIDMFFSENNVFIKQGNLTSVIRLVDGRFPNYEQCFPKNTFQTYLPVKKLMSAIERFKSLKLTYCNMQILKGDLFITSKTKNTDVIESIPMPKDVKFEADFSVDQLYGIFSRIKSSHAKIYTDYNGYGNDKCINPVTFDNGIYQYLLMPTRV